MNLDRSAHILLTDAKNVIADDDDWCCNALAVDESPDEIAPNHPDAVRWCAIGACCAVANAPTLSQADEDEVFAYATDLLDLAARAVHIDVYPDPMPSQVQQSISLTNLNDTHGHDYVMAVFDVAISATAEAPVGSLTGTPLPW